MRIAIIGAPGTGKSSLGRALAKEHELTLIDGYIKKLQKETDLALGPWCSYTENLTVAAYRYAAETKVGFDKRITVSTILDDLAYATIKSDLPLGDTQEDRIFAYRRAKLGMQGLALVYMETWDYDITLWLPYSDKQREEKKDTWEAKLDSLYPDVIESFNVPYVLALEGTTSERLKTVNEFLEMVNYEPEPETTETD